MRREKQWGKTLLIVYMTQTLDSQNQLTGKYLSHKIFPWIVVNICIWSHLCHWHNYHHSDKVFENTILNIKCLWIKHIMLTNENPWSNSTLKLSLLINVTYFTMFPCISISTGTVITVDAIHTKACRVHAWCRHALIDV